MALSLAVHCDVRNFSLSPGVDGSTGAPDRNDVGSVVLIPLLRNEPGRRSLIGMFVALCMHDMK